MYKENNKEQVSMEIISYELKLQKMQIIKAPLDSLPLSAVKIDKKIFLNMLQDVNEKNKENFRIDMNLSGERTSFLPNSTFVGSVNTIVNRKPVIVNIFYSKIDNLTVPMADMVRG
jgi:hypothetical protein